MKSGLAAARSITYLSHMIELVLTLPGEALATARIPPAELEQELRRRLAGMEKADFQHWLGEHRIPQPHGAADYDLERKNLKAWLKDD